MKSLEKFSKNLIKELTHHLGHYATHRDPETLHQVRVGVKKIKALIGLIDYNQKKFKGHRAFIPFRNIFRKAGAVREPDVLRNLLMGSTTKKSVERNKRAMTPAEEAFIEDIPFFLDVIRKEWKKLKPHLTKVSKKVFNHYMDEKLREIELQLTPKPNMKDIHKTRKVIKTALYLSRVKDRISEETKTFFSEMEELIGQLHDKQTLLANLRQAKPKVNEAKLNKLRAGCDKDKKNITRLASTYYHIHSLNI